MGVGKFVMCILYCLYYAYKLGYSAAAGGAWISKGLERRVLLPLRAVVDRSRRSFGSDLRGATCPPVATVPVKTSSG